MLRIFQASVNFLAFKMYIKKMEKILALATVNSELWNIRISNLVINVYKNAFFLYEKLSFFLWGQIISIMSVVTVVIYNNLFTFSSWMRRYWFYVKNDFRNFQQVYTFWGPLSQKKWFSRKCLSVCM